MADFEIYKREKNYHFHEGIIKWIVDIIMVVCFSFLIAIYMFGKTTVVGHSMSPVLEDGNGVLIDKVSYCLGEPERFDVIMFEPEVANVSKYYIKRIIGLPGETVQIKDGKIYINGDLLDESSYRSAINADKDSEDKDNDAQQEANESDTFEDIIYNAGLASEPITLGYDEYFVLGDNRNNSEDSRFANVGNVKYNSILGKIWAISSPMGSIGIVK